MAKTTRKVLYSPGFGAGWTTWNDDNLADFMATYQPIIEFIEGGGKFGRDEDHALLRQMRSDAEQGGLIEKDGHICVLGAQDLRVAEVSGRYRISEYDGSESIREESDEVWR